MRGFYSGALKGDVVIKRTKKNSPQTIIALDSIISLRKISPGRRTIYGAIGTSLTAGGATILDNGGNTPGSALKGAFIIPVIGVGVFFICAVPVTLIVEKINEKKQINGWRFDLQQ